jgi:hypothetical protein
VSRLDRLLRQPTPEVASTSEDAHDLVASFQPIEVPRCRWCSRPVVEITTKDTRALVLLDPDEVEIVRWTALEELGAERAVEDEDRVTGYTDRVVHGVRVAGFPGVPRIRVRLDHTATCPELPHRREARRRQAGQAEREASRG